MKWALVLCLLPVAALADEPLTGSEFEAYAQGKTLTYAQEGHVWGREQYLPGRRAIWAFEGAECRAGTWVEVTAGLICFTYDDAPDAPQCWRFYKGDAGLRAQSELDPEGTPLAAVNETTAPLVCPGPDVGV